MSREALTEWIDEHMPALAERIRNLHPDSVRRVLNYKTGLDIGPFEFVDESCARFQRALEEKQK